MINSYKILNRKISTISKIFQLNLIIIIILVIWGIINLEYQSFIKLHSKILNFESYYTLEILIPTKEVKQITKQNKVIINSKEYTYTVSKIDNNCIFKNNQNYQKIYLSIPSLEENYLINGYELDLKIPKEKKKIINYIKNK